MNSLKRSGKVFAQSADVSADRDPLLLILALMAPFVQRKGTGSTDVVYLIDTSGSMKHLTKGGNTRLGEAVSEIKEQIAASDGAKISIVTCDGTGTNLLAVHTSEKSTVSDAGRHQGHGHSRIAF